MPTPLNCWRCGNDVSYEILPLSRRAECAACKADLHVCKMCKFFRHKQQDYCAEERADIPSSPERANFCDYFAISQHAYRGAENFKAQAARLELAALFGIQPNSKDELKQQATDSDKARSELEKLFGISSEKHKKEP